MDGGKTFGPKPEIQPATTVPPALSAYVKWLLADARTLEVWGLVGARLARIDCTAAETQALELDSGDWCLVRVSGLPTTPAPGQLEGIVRFRRVVGKAADESEAAVDTDTTRAE